MQHRPPQPYLQPQDVDSPEQAAQRVNFALSELPHEDPADRCRQLSRSMVAHFGTVSMIQSRNLGSAAQQIIQYSAWHLIFHLHLVRYAVFPRAMSRAQLDAKIEKLELQAFDFECAVDLLLPELHCTELDAPRTN